MPDKLTPAELAALQKIEQLRSFGFNNIDGVPLGVVATALRELAALREQVAAEADEYKISDDEIDDMVSAVTGPMDQVRLSLMNANSAVRRLTEQLTAEREKRAALVREWRAEAKERIETASRWGVDDVECVDRAVGQTLNDAADQLAALDKPEGA